uniref:GCR111 n=1 Tax=Schmidtea mediterranea TaxID=79327 RepID=A0A193KUL2_SCHMD|nr:GCR111 [Schmidtea mediterranea]
MKAYFANFSNFQSANNYPDSVNVLGYLNNCITIELSLFDNLESILLFQISPYIIGFVTMTNLLICLTLTRPFMITPTNIILMGIALSDMLTGLLPLPIYIMRNFSYQFLELEKSYYQFLYVNYYLTSFLPTVFHTTSIWFTLQLALQRVIYVKFSNNVSRFCTTEIAWKMFIITPILSSIFHSPDFIVSFRNSFSENNNGSFGKKNFAIKCNVFSDTSFAIYTILRITLVHLIPCCSLTVLTNILIFVLRQKYHLHNLLIPQASIVQSRDPEKRSLNVLLNVSSHNEAAKRSRFKQGSRTIDIQSTSKMLLMVLIMFLLVEIPIGGVITAYTLLRLLGLKLNPVIWKQVTNTCNFVILVSYPINFFIYCAMLPKFRLTFYSLIRCKPSRFSYRQN